jgi:peroxiredoxin
VPATEFKQQINKTGTTGWVQVKVSTVYSDGEVVAGKIHGLPGSWS